MKENVCVTMPFNPNRTPPKQQHRDRSLSCGRPGQPYKRKAEGGSAEKERKSRSSSKKPNISKSSSQVNADTNNINSPPVLNLNQVNAQPHSPKPVKSKVGKKPASDTHCSGCGKIFDDDNCVLCECCKRWYHATCVDLTVDEIKAFALLGPKAHWFCENCDAGAKELYEQHVEFKTRLDKFEKAIESVNVQQSDMKSSIAKLQRDSSNDRKNIETIYDDTTTLKVQEAANSSKIKANSESVVKMRKDITDLEETQKANTEKLKNIKETIKTEVNDIITKLNLNQFPPLVTTDDNTDAAPPAVKEKLTQFRQMVNTQCAERDEIMKRKCQLMIFNLKEPGTAEADKQQVYDLLNILQIDEQIQIEDLTRMGKQREGKHKPIRITVQNVTVKRKILAKATKLRDIPSTDKFAYIKPNLTIQQSKDSKKLNEDLRTRRLAEPTKTLKIYRGKIIEVRPNNQ